jgi:RNA polymerase sigma factor (sigma-70 family)
MNGDILVEQTLAGDHQAFNSLITDYYTDIYGMILSWVKNPEDAKDLTQDVFISAYLDLPSLKDHKQFYSWLRQIARHKCQNWKRKQIDFIPLHDDLISKEPSTDEVLILHETLAKVMEAIDNLPEPEKRLLKEHYLDDVSYDELEARHGVSTKTLVVRLVRARRKIRDQLEKTLSAFVAFLHDHIESILTGGMEIMKLSVKTKLIVGGIIAILILGGSGVLIDRHYVQNKSERETSQASQENYSKSPVKSVSDTEKSSIKGVNSLDQKGVTREKVQTDEFKAETLAMNESKGDKSAKDTDSKASGVLSNESKELTPEIKQKIEEYAKVAYILPLLSEAYRKQSASTKSEHANLDEIKVTANEIRGYWRQLAATFPNLVIYQEFNDPPNPLDLWRNEDLRPLAKYFGTELPWDGNTDYLQAKPLNEGKLSLEEAVTPTWRRQQLQSGN